MYKSPHHKILPKIQQIKEVLETWSIFWQKTLYSFKLVGGIFITKNENIFKSADNFIKIPNMNYFRRGNVALTQAIFPIIAH
jgi:hypothetical protein